MVDLPLMAALVAALPDRVRLVLVGDVDQLPSVGPGQVLKDLIDSDRFPVVRLDRVFRQDHDSRIIDNAHRINSGQMPDVEPAKERRTDFYLIEREAPPGSARHPASRRGGADTGVVRRGPLRRRAGLDPHAQGRPRGIDAQPQAAGPAQPGRDEV